MSYELLLARRRILMASKRVWPTLLYISEAEVSMLCVDGSDGKGGYIDLTAISSDGGPMGTLTWISSNNALATVTPISLTKARVTAVSGAALGSAVTISCTQGAIVKTCSVTVFSTMPSGLVEGAGLWLCKGGKGEGSVTTSNLLVNFISSNVPSIDINSTRLIGKYAPISNAVLYGVLRSTNSGVDLVYPQPMGSELLAPKATISIINGNGSIWTRPYQHVFGPSFTNGVKSKVDMSKASDGYYVNGTVYSPTMVSLGNTGSSSQFFHGVYSNHDKNICWTGGADKSNSQLIDYTSCLYAFVYQNYIRYTDRDTWVNYTVIPNIGTLGVDGDLSSNNVPSAWFGV